eukprot:evm.model.scf_89.1 EVM.evm.TU.scf_89.1   scf_89:314-679(+)
MPDLLHSVVVAANKSNGANMPFVKEMLDYIWPNMMQSMAKEVDLDVLTTFLDATASIVDIVDRQLLDQEKVGNTHGCRPGSVNPWLAFVDKGFANARIRQYWTHVCTRNDQKASPQTLKSR